MAHKFTYLPYYSTYVAPVVPTWLKIPMNSGPNNSVVLKSNGAAYAWGYGGWGTLGNNSTANNAVPVLIYGSHTFCTISTGYMMTGIDNHGKAWGWGLNSKGQVGDNSITNRSIPVAVCGVHTFCAISFGASSWHTLMLDKNNKVWAWGKNDNGQLGNNSLTSARTPIAVCGNHTFQIMATDDYNSVALENGKAWTWGDNASGQLGNNTTGNTSTPVAVCGNHTFCKISVGGQNFVVAIDNHGKAYSWGNNLVGQLGDGTKVSKRTPIAVYGTKTFCHIHAQYLRTLAIDKNGKGWGWGTQPNGALGNNSISDFCTPVAICGNHTFCYIQGTSQGGLAIDKNNKYWSWGYNTNNELGNNNTTSVRTPIAVCVI